MLQLLVEFSYELRRFIAAKESGDFDIIIFKSSDLKGEDMRIESVRYDKLYMASTQEFLNFADKVNVTAQKLREAHNQRKNKEE